MEESIKMVSRDTLQTDINKGGGKMDETTEKNL
jgi:hypothetical protein